MSPELRAAMQGWSRSIDELRQAPEFAPLFELEQALPHAEAEAYRKRTRIYAVLMHPDFHALAAEAAQQWAELMQGTADHPAPARNADGTAPPLRTAFGIDVRIADTVDRFMWDTGDEPLSLFLFAFTTTGELL